MSKKRPKHEDGTCGYEVLKKVNGIFTPVALKDSRGHCPGDPMCPYTELARIQHRFQMQAPMERVKTMLKNRGASAKMLDPEFLYELVCSVKQYEPVAPVKGVGWPIDEERWGPSIDTEIEE